MKKAISSPFLSAFVFPGLGQINNRQILKGLSLILITLFTLIFIFLKVLSSVLRAIPDKEKITLSPHLIASLTQKVQTENKEIILFAIIFLSIIWVFNIVDAYMNGKKIDSKNPI
jgi:TM2 domain-containing membrane protein YozV